MLSVSSMDYCLTGQPLLSRHAIDEIAVINNTSATQQPQPINVSVTNNGCGSGCGKFLLLLLLIPVGLFFAAVFLPTVTDNKEESQNQSSIKNGDVVMYLLPRC